MLLLFETACGFALFEVLRVESIFSDVENLDNEFSTAEKARTMVKLKAFDKFGTTLEAREAVANLLDGAPSDGFFNFLKANCGSGTLLLVSNTKLGELIKEKLNIDCVHKNAVTELLRGVRSQLTDLLSGLGDIDLAPMSLGLSRSLARDKLQFSSNKVDAMIIQTLGSIDDVDKELNKYAMRVCEWYGWHFPELAKIVKGSILYVKVVKLMRDRTNAAKLDFSELLDNEVEAELKEAANMSMGSEVSEIDMLHILDLCDNVVSLAENKDNLHNYLKYNMNKFARKLTKAVGVLVGARLISHAGGLFNLSKLTTSKIQVLGAEKGFLRALNTNHHTPKHGSIYYEKRVVEAKESWEKGKAAKRVARYAARAVRKDVFRTGQYNSRAVENRLKTFNPAADSLLQTHTADSSKERKKRKHEGEEDTEMPAKKKRRG